MSMNTATIDIGIKSQSQSRPRRDSKAIAALFEKLPPHAIEAEMCLLGSMLIEPQINGIPQAGHRFRT